MKFQLQIQNAISNFKLQVQFAIEISFANDIMYMVGKDPLALKCLPIAQFNFNCKLKKIQFKFAIEISFANDVMYLPCVESHLPLSVCHLPISISIAN